MNDSREKFLLFRIRAFGDEGAFAALLKKYGPGVHRKLHFKLPRDEDVEDAYNNVCLRTWQYISSNSVEHFSGLMHTITRGVIYEFYKTREKEGGDVVITDAMMQTQKELSHSQTQIEDSVDVNILLEAIKQLPDEYQEALTLRHLEGYKVKEIAEQLGKTENATSVIIHRARKKLCELLERKGTEEE